MLEKEYQYYKQHKDELIRDYHDHYVVIKNQQVIGAYSSREKALEKTQKAHELGSFLVQFVASDDDQIQRFHSRVVFDDRAAEISSRVHH